MVSSKGKQKEFAEESEKTKRAREKLRKRLETMDQQFTKDALEKKSFEIHQWISRHADKRIHLPNKSISLFDENQNMAKTSHRVGKIVKKLQEEIE